MTLTPGRVASRKLAFNVRVLRSLAGRPLYRDAQRLMRKLGQERARHERWGYQ